MSRNKNISDRLQPVRVSRLQMKNTKKGGKKNNWHFFHTDVLMISCFLKPRRKEPVPCGDDGFFSFKKCVDLTELTFLSFLLLFFWLSCHCLSSSSVKPSACWSERCRRDAPLTWDTTWEKKRFKIPFFFIWNEKRSATSVPRFSTAWITVAAKLSRGNTTASSLRFFFLLFPTSASFPSEKVFRSRDRIIYLFWSRRGGLHTIISLV